MSDSPIPRAPWRRALAATSLLATVVLGSDLGKQWLSPGDSLRVRCESYTLPTPRIECEKRAGNAEVWGTFRLRVVDPTPRPLRAVLSLGETSRGDTLDVRQVRAGPEWADVHIVRRDQRGATPTTGDAGAPPERHPMFFQWWAGATLIISTIPQASSPEDPLRSLTWQSWQFYAANGLGDSSMAAAERMSRQRITLLLLGLSIVAGLVAVVIPERAAPTPHTDRRVSEECIRLIIERVEGAKAAETLRMQWMLREVLIHGAAPEALIPSSGRLDVPFQVDEAQLFFQAFRDFNARFRSTLHELEDVRDLLDGLGFV